MSRGIILVVEPDKDIQNMVKIYFTAQGYQVEVCDNVQDAIDSTRKQLPSVILMELDLPDKSGWDLMKDLRATTRTSHIPIIILTNLDSQSKIDALKQGAEIYLAKPVDIEELKLQIQNAVGLYYRPKRINPTSGFPTGSFIEEHLRALMPKNIDWVYWDIKIANFEAFRELRGWPAGDEIIKAMALLITDILKGYGTEDDLAGHPGGDNFVIITESTDWMLALETLKLRADALLSSQYSEEEKRNGYLLFNERQFRFMKLRVGVFVAAEHPRDIDIRQIVDIAHEDRRRKSPNYVENSDDNADILTAW